MRREIARVDLVHRGEIVHVGEKHGGLHYAVKGRSCRFHYALEIFKHTFGLHRGISLHNLLRLWIERDLPGKKHESIRADGLGIGADRFWPSIGCHSFDHTILLIALFRRICSAPAFLTLLTATKSLCCTASEGAEKLKFLSFRAKKAISLFLGFNRREIPRFARNDKTNYFFRGLFSRA